MDSMPLVTFSIWSLIKDTLLTDKVKVKEQLIEAEQSLEKIQDEEVRKSVSATDTQSVDEEESQLKTKAKRVKVKEFSSSSSSGSDLEEEESSEGGPRVRFTLPQQAFPVMEMDDPNNPGQRAGYHQALTIKELKGLKEASAAYGALAPFTLTMVESYQAQAEYPVHLYRPKRDFDITTIIVAAIAVSATAATAVGIA
ncbi:hypothetical protein STEG23_032579, partial [Scotinomys teguina]